MGALLAIKGTRKLVPLHGDYDFLKIAGPSEDIGHGRHRNPAVKRTLLVLFRLTARLQQCPRRVKRGRATGHETGKIDVTCR